jgi:molybdenum cofactor sulfurtransferase
MSEDEYAVIFTSGATGAIKLVADMFPWDLGGALCYTENIHTSLLGLREFSDTNLLIPSKSIHSNDEIIFNETKEEESVRIPLDSKERINLFVYPGECNFSGCKSNFDNVGKVISHICY